MRALASAPVFAVLLGDSKRYVEWASEIVGGAWLGTGAFYQAPLYPYVVAVAFKVFGVSLEIVRILQALAGSLACVLVAIAGRRFFDWRTGLVAGMALALYPPAIFFDGHIQKSSLDLVLMAALVVGAAAYASHRHGRWLILLGASLGCLILNRENARLLFPFLAVWLLALNRDLPVARRARAVAVFTLATLLPIAPVIVRNYYVARELLISTSQLGPNFYIGNRSGASGVYEPLVPGRASVIYEQEDAVKLATTALGRPLSPSEVSNYWLSKAFGEIRSDPAAWTRLMFRKLLLSVNTIESMDTESLEFHAAYSPVLRALGPFTFGVLLTLAVFGVAITASDFRRLFVLYGIGLVFIGSVVVFFVLARYRYPVVPVLALFAGAALVNLSAVWPLRRRSAQVGLVCAIAVGLVVNTPMRATSDETSANFGTELLRLERPREAIPFLEKAVELLPDDPGAHRDLALAYLKGGEPAAAAREYSRVVELEPGDAANHRELAVAAESAGDRAAALTHVREAVRLEPSNVSTQVKLGDLLMRLDRTLDARQAFAHILTMDTAGPVDTVGVRVRIASLDVREGRVADALKTLDEAAAAARSSGQDAVARDVDATIQALRGRFKTRPQPQS